MTTREKKFAEFYDKKIIVSPDLAYVEDVTEVFTASGRKTGMFLIKECCIDEKRGNEYTARFVSSIGETFSKEFTAKQYDEMGKDYLRLAKIMHDALVEYVAFDVGRPEFIPKEVKIIYPKLKDEIITKIIEQLNSRKSKYTNHDNRIAYSKIKRVNLAFENPEAV